MADTAFFAPLDAGTSTRFDLDATGTVLTRVGSATYTWFTAKGLTDLTGRCYVEFVIEALASGSDAGVLFGVASSTMPFNAAPGYSGYSGTGQQAAGYPKVWTYAASPVDSPVRMAVGVRIGMAVDRNAGTIWWRDGNGWTNRVDASSQPDPVSDPALGKGGTKFTGSAVPDLFIAAALYDPGVRVRLISDPAALAYSVPAGFTIVGATPAAVKLHNRPYGFLLC